MSRTYDTEYDQKRCQVIKKEMCNLNAINKHVKLEYEMYTFSDETMFFFNYKFSPICNWRIYCLPELLILEIV